VLTGSVGADGSRRADLGYWRPVVPDRGLEVDARGANRLIMEILIFTLNAIFVYLFSDWIIRVIEEKEEKRGAALKQRQVIFFVVFLVLILVSFQILRTIFATP
jgi:hypothetical protein